MALLVASLLMAALAPVMTRKMKEEVNIYGTINNGNDTHGAKIFEYDPIADSDKEFSKFTFTPPAGVKTISLIIQGAGGGGGGSTSGYSSYDNVLDTTGAAEKTIEIKDNLIGIKNVRIDLTGGGGGGGGSVIPSIDCKEPNLHKYINETQGNGTKQCVTKFNIGDSGGPAFASGAIKCIQGDTSYKDKCSKCGITTDPSYGKCYYIGTYTDCHADSKGTYSGCGRTASQFYAANDACNSYTGANVSKGGWRLPKVNDVAKWYAHADELNINQGANGLQSCVYSPNMAGVGHCAGNIPTKGCYGSESPGDDCDIDRTWLTDFATGSTTLRCWLNGGILSYNCTATADMAPNNGMSARCLTTNAMAFNYTYKTAGGGSSGVRIYNYTLPEKYNNKPLLTKGNKITISRGQNGVGGDKGINGTAGEPSCITIRDASNTSIFYFCANGGNFGTASASAGVGAGGSQNVNCRIGTSSANYNNVNCANYGSYVQRAGITGNTATVSYNQSVSGGNGGNSTYNTSLTGGTGGALNNINGLAPSASGSNLPYGAGGGGGSANTANAGKGGNGYIGFAKITYDIERTGASGGGGAGGAMIALTSLEVTQGKSYEVIAGKGGNGGNVNTDGKDGYLSSFKYSNTQIAKAEGGTGGKTADNSQENGKGGTGGTGGKKPVVTFGFGIKTAAGENGKKGGDFDTLLNKSIGANGGKSGIGTLGACGALTFYSTDADYSEDCKITNVTGENAPYILNTLIMGTDYGKAGSGGGSGAFESYSLYGAGGNGANGYVFVKW